MGRQGGAVMLSANGVLFLAMPPFAPAWITILVANEALFATSLLIYCATAETLAVRTQFCSVESDCWWSPLP